MHETNGTDQVGPFFSHNSDCTCMKQMELIKVWLQLQN